VQVKDSGQDIRDLIASIEPGDTLLIDGLNIEIDSLIINKPMTVLGKNNPVLKGTQKNHIIIVRADDVCIKGITISNSGLSYVEDRSGIKVDSSKNFILEECKVLDCMFALHATESSNIKIINNTITGNAEREASSGNGVHLWYCKGATILNNKISNHRDGIYFEFVSEIKVNGNTSINNLRYGLHFMFSHDAVYSDNIFKNNGSGVAVMYTHNVKMTNNIFEDNWGSASYGLLLKDISDSEIRHNTFYRNTSGIFLDGGGTIDISQNNFQQNGWAIKLLASSENNTIKQNNFIANTFDVSTNSFTNSNLFEKNYWDKYSGYDLNKDGIGDVAYHPVRLFSLMVANNPPLLILLHSFFIGLLDLAENIIPSLTPDTLLDAQPLMNPIS